MNTLVPLRTAEVTDATGRSLGIVTVESVAGGLLTGTLSPGPDYPEVRDTFANFYEAAERNSFHFLDEAEARISALGLRLRYAGATVPVEDVQLFSTWEFSCRLPATPAEQNGHHPPA